MSNSSSSNRCLMEATIGEARREARAVQWMFGTKTPSESTISGKGLGIIKGRCFCGPFRCDVQPSRRCYRSSELHKWAHPSPASTFSLPNSSQHTQLHQLPCPMARTPAPHHHHRVYFPTEEARPWPAAAFLAGGWEHEQQWPRRAGSRSTAVSKHRTRA